MGWYYNVTGNSTPPTANNYNWYGLNTINQDAALIYIAGNQAVTKIRVYASARSSSVYTRLAMWLESNGYLATQSSTFTMTTGSESVGGQAWQEVTLSSPLKISSNANYYVGLYRNPSGAHISGTHTSIDGYQKTNTNGFPSIVGMSGYSQDTGEGLLVGVFLISAPTAPSSATATRNSDYSATINFTNNSTSDAPYDSIEVQRWDNVTQAYYKIATISGSATSYTDTTIAPNKMLKYAICAKNTVGNSTFAFTDYIKTTPSAPSNVVAIRSGSSAIISWTDNSAVEDHFYIQSSEYSGGVWGSWTNESEVSANTTSWTDTTPPNIVKYRVKSLTDTYNSLSSAYVESNSLAILQAPNPPTNLAPDNIFFDATEINRFSWQHNPLDGSRQTKYSIQYKVNGGSYPGTPQINAAVSGSKYHDFAANTFANGTVYKYQVKTWGAYSTGSAWSTEKTFACWDKPVGTITSPTIASDYASSILTVTWIFTGSLQTEFLAKLYDNNNALLETKSVSGSDTTFTFNTSLSNLTNYTVTLQLKDQTNLWSTETSVNFNVVFAVPPTPTYTLTSNEINGSVNIAIVNPSPTGLEIEAVSNNIYRSLDGINYTLMLSNVPLNTSVTDYIPLLGAKTYYYVESVSATPTIATSIIDNIEIICNGYYLLNTGSNYLDYVLLYKESELSEAYDRETVLQQYEGRKYKVKYQGEALSNEINFACEIDADEVAIVKNIIQSTDDIFYRDYTGRYFNCAILNPQFSKQEKGQTYKFSCNIVRLEE